MSTVHTSYCSPQRIAVLFIYLLRLWIDGPSSVASALQNNHEWADACWQLVDVGTYMRPMTYAQQLSHVTAAREWGRGCVCLVTVDYVRLVSAWQIVHIYTFRCPIETIMRPSYCSRATSATLYIYVGLTFAFVVYYLSAGSSTCTLCSAVDLLRLFQSANRRCWMNYWSPDKVLQQSMWG